MKAKKKYQWKAVIEYVSFTNERARQRAYEQYADTIIAGYNKRLEVCAWSLGSYSGGKGKNVRFNNVPIGIFSGYSIVIIRIGIKA